MHLIRTQNHIREWNALRQQGAVNLSLRCALPSTKITRSSKVKWARVRKNGEKGNLNVPYGYCTFYKCFVFAFCQLLAERLNTEKDRNGDELKLSDQLENGRIYLRLYKCLKISLKCLYWLKYRPEVYRKWFWLNIFLLSGLCDPNHRIFQTSSS